jgi:hypothetical protein
LRAKVRCRIWLSRAPSTAGTISGGISKFILILYVGERRVAPLSHTPSRHRAPLEPPFREAAVRTILTAPSTCKRQVVTVCIRMDGKGISGWMVKGSPRGRPR